MFNNIIYQFIGQHFLLQYNFRKHELNFTHVMSIDKCKHVICVRYVVVDVDKIVGFSWQIQTLKSCSMKTNPVVKDFCYIIELSIYMGTLYQFLKKFYGPVNEKTEKMYRNTTFWSNFPYIFIVFLYIIDRTSEACSSEKSPATYDFFAHSNVFLLAQFICKK